MFALEWNESYRIVGFFGDELTVLEIRSRIPQPPMETIPGEGSDFMRFRLEVPLAEDEDRLFGSAEEEPSD